MTYLAERWAVVRSPAIGWMVLGALLANIGAGMVLLTMTWTVVNIHESVAALAGLMFCFWLPSVILAPLIGPAVDAYRRKTIVAATKGVRVVVLVLVSYMYYRSPGLFWLYVLAAGMGACAAFYTPAFMAMVREVVPDKNLLHANASVDIAFEVGFIVGMPLSGFLMIVLSPSMVFLLAAATFFGGMLCILQLQRPWFRFGIPANGTGNFWRDAKDGLAYLGCRRPLLLLYSVQLLMYVALMTTSILLAPFAKQVLEADSGEFAAIETALSVGTVVGAIFLPMAVSRWGEGRPVLASTAVMTAAFIVFALSSSVVQSVLLYLVIGFCLAAWPVVTTAAQHLTDQAYQGRVQSAVNAVSGLVILMVYVLVGGASTMTSVRWTYASVVLVSALACVVTLYAYFSRGRVARGAGDAVGSSIASGGLSAGGTSAATLPVDRTGT